MNENDYWLWLFSIEGIGAIKCRELLNEFKHPYYIFQAAEKELVQIKGITPALAKQIITSKSIEHIEEIRNRMRKNHIKMVRYGEDEYPNSLKKIHDYPQVIFYRGDLPEPEKISVGIVGARNCSLYGAQCAYEFAKELSKYKIQIISGMALGIDSKAHQGALHGKAKTFAVLGNGLDRCYPASNIELFHEIERNGHLSGLLLFLRLRRSLPAGQGLPQAALPDKASGASGRLGLGRRFRSRCF